MPPDGTRTEPCQLTTAYPPCQLLQPLTAFDLLTHLRETLQKTVIPAKAGIQGLKSRSKSSTDWMPAFAGMTPKVLLQRFLRCHALSSTLSLEYSPASAIYIQAEERAGSSAPPKAQPPGIAQAKDKQAVLENRLRQAIWRALANWAGHRRGTRNSRSVISQVTRTEG